MRALTAAQFRAGDPAGREVVDIREPSEVAQVAVRGAKEIPMGQFFARLAEVDFSKEVVLVCRSGARTRQLAWLLGLRGREAATLEGGIRDLLAAWPESVEVRALEPGYLD